MVAFIYELLGTGTAPTDYSQSSINTSGGSRTQRLTCCYQIPNSGVLNCRGRSNEGGDVDDGVK